MRGARRCYDWGATVLHVGGSRSATSRVRAPFVGLAVIAGALLLLGAAITVARYQAFAARNLAGIDRDLYVALGERWATSGSMYLPYQFSAYPVAVEQLPGAREVATMPGLYPPIAGPFFWLIGFVPAILWWAIPLSIIAWSLRGSRPWTWPILAAVLCWPNTASSVIAGNSTMWVTAGVAFASRWGWPAVAVLLKPSFAPLALIGMWHRGFWVAAALLLIVSIPMAGEWVRYVQVLANGQGPGVLYSVPDIPLVVAPMLAEYSRHGALPVRHATSPARWSLPPAARGLLSRAAVWD
jgi:hypothetical protein